MLAFAKLGSVARAGGQGARPLSGVIHSGVEQQQLARLITSRPPVQVRPPLPTLPMARAWSPEELAAALTRAGVAVTGRTVRNWIARRELPARRNPRTGGWRVSDGVVRARFPLLFTAAPRLAA